MSSRPSAQDEVSSPESNAAPLNSALRTQDSGLRTQDSALSTQDWLALGVLLGASLLYYPDLVFRGLVLADYDVFAYFYPLRHFAAEAVRQGRLPLWNPDLFLGSPFLANPQTAVFYPLTALFYVLPVPYAYSASLVGHLFLAGALFYLFARRTLALGALASLLGGLAFTFSGFFAGQAGHLNQVSAAAWLPLLVTAFDEAARRPRPSMLVAAAAVLAIQLLAGHPQETYMSLIVVGVFVVVRALLAEPKRLGWALGVLGAGVALGLGLASLQLVPTLELARESVRSGGLDYQDASFVTLPPWDVPWALLPGFQWNVIASTEWLGYVGVLPVVAGLLALLAARRPATLAAALVAGLGFVLAMGDALPLYSFLFEHLPFFDRFRVPARWLFIYTFGAATLAALGLEWARMHLGNRHSPSLRPHPDPLPGGEGNGSLSPWERVRVRAGWARLAGVAALVGVAGLWMPQFAQPVPRRLVVVWLALGAAGVLLLVAIRGGHRWRNALSGLLIFVAAAELWLAPSELPFRYAVPADFYAMPRDSTRFIQAAPPGRVLSAATDVYEIKETPDYRQRYAWLHPRALLNYLVGVKHTEILTPNLPLLYGLASADGYDGGVLPGQRFVELSKLLMPAEAVRSDGVWRSRLEFVPPPRLLDLLGVRSVLASNIRDATVDGVPHDRALAVPLAPGQATALRRLPEVQATALGVVSTFDGPPLPDGTEVGRVVLQGVDGSVQELPLRLGLETGYEQERPPETTRTPKALGRWYVDGRWDYHARQSIRPTALSEVAVRGSAPEGRLVLKALTLIDDQHQQAHSLVLSDRLERTTFFDLKVYQLRDALPRAYLVSRAEVLDDADALERLADESFDPRAEVALAPGPGAQPLAGAGGPVPAQVERPQPEHLLARLDAAAPGYLVVTESWAPGWRATVDGQPVAVLRANYAFQAVPVPPGAHLVELRYEPRSFTLGLGLSLASLVVASALLLIGHRTLARGGVRH
ncbi:MAG: YfhO family protein [Chloroflexi bacterium]|nr:YfhO family protein [Chloroflexota bacterium]